MVFLLTSTFSLQFVPRNNYVVLVVVEARPWKIARFARTWIRPWVVQRTTRDAAADADDVLQMNAVLRDDFEKKMTVVGLLKQYAEQRDVDTFARGLSVILASAKHQALLQHIR